MDAKAQRIIDDLATLITYDDPYHASLNQSADYTTSAEMALRTIKAACALISDQSDRIEKQNQQIIKLESKLASAGESDQDESFDNVKTIIQCNEKIRKLTDQILFLSGQISVYDRLFAPIFEDGSPTHNI